MKILACVQIGDNQITQAWEYLDSESSGYLVVMNVKDESDKDRQLVIKMRKKSIKDIPGTPIAEKAHLGTLDIKDAVFLR